MSTATLVQQQAVVPPPVVGRVVMASPHPLTSAVLEQWATEPFIGTHEMFHVENMGPLAGHFTYLGRALERKEKKPSDLAHAHALAEELTRLIRLQMIEANADDAGVVKP